MGKDVRRRIANPANATRMTRLPIHKRDYISVSKIDHRTNKTVSFGMDPSTLFANSGACMLMPAVDQGPLCT